MNRRGFLSASAAAAATTIASSTLPAARAALPPATPAGDDVGFLAFGAVAEGVLSAFYLAALGLHGAWRPAERTLLAEARDAHRQNVDRLNTVLGPDDAVTPGDFERRVRVGSRRGALKVGRDLESLVGGTYLGGLAAAGDYGTRLLLGRLMGLASANDAVLTRLAGETLGGPPSPVDLDAAGLKLDTYLKDPNS